MKKQSSLHSFFKSAIKEELLEVVREEKVEHIKPVCKVE
jgi:hypothetical protein